MDTIGKPYNPSGLLPLSLLVISCAALALALAPWRKLMEWCPPPPMGFRVYLEAHTLPRFLNTWF